jgi:hypothetical protein
VQHDCNAVTTAAGCTAPAKLADPRQQPCAERTTARCAFTCLGEGFRCTRRTEKLGGMRHGSSRVNRHRVGKGFAGRGVLAMSAGKMGETGWG